MRNVFEHDQVRRLAIQLVARPAVTAPTSLATRNQAQLDLMNQIRQQLLDADPIDVMVIVADVYHGRFPN